SFLEQPTKAKVAATAAATANFLNNMASLSQKKFEIKKT
ncbi:hypothetical protein J582_3260, partial [Acinetobacter sp. 1566109]